jgi:hypothetical protein
LELNNKIKLRNKVCWVEGHKCHFTTATSGQVKEGWKGERNAKKVRNVLITLSLLSSYPFSSSSSSLSLSVVTMAAPIAVLCNNTTHFLKQIIWTKQK